MVVTLDSYIRGDTVASKEDEADLDRIQGRVNRSAKKAALRKSCELLIERCRETGNKKTRQQEGLDNMKGHAQKQKGSPYRLVI